MGIANLLTSEAGAKLERLLQPTVFLESDLLNNSLSLAAALGVTEFMTSIGTNLITLCCALNQVSSC
jgi:hypothetical protein